LKTVVFDDQRISDLVAKANDVDTFGEVFHSIGVEKDGEIIGGVVYNLASKTNICMHVASTETAWMTKQFLFFAFAYPFLQLNKRRVTGLVPAKNINAQKFDEKLGFKFEGIMRHGDTDDDLIIYGMLKEECRFIGADYAR
jgi:RimJ/RimL family protein N-acetyltransferase